MTNPWLEIPLADYEGHMALPGVAQAALLAGRFGDVVTVAGVRTLEEEVAAEIAHAAEEVAHERGHRRPGSEGRH